MTRNRIPTSIKLPFGYTVKVRQCSDEKMKEKDLDGAEAGWLEWEKTIYLRASLSNRS